MVFQRACFLGFKNLDEQDEMVTRHLSLYSIEKPNFSCKMDEMKRPLDGKVTVQK